LPRVRADREERLDRGWDLLEQEEFEGAIEVASELLAERPGDTDARFLSARARFEAGEYLAADQELRALLELEPENLPARLTLAAVLYETCRIDEGLALIGRILPEDRGNPEAHHLKGLLLEMAGQCAAADACFAEAARLDPDHYDVPESMAPSEFDATVEEALAGLPAQFRRQIGDLPILIEDVPSAALLATLEEPAPDLLGLFVGTPLTEKSTRDLPGVPDAIYLFKRNLERLCVTREELVEEIGVTLLHEIGHFLGMDEEDLDEAGYA
jgi:predicted Zn-dependent protease with MMP-like domain/Tfp pilus assembly protein PilF